MHQHVPQRRKVTKRRAAVILLQVVPIVFVVNALGAYFMEDFSFEGALLVTASLGFFFALHLYLFGWPRRD